MDRWTDIEHGERKRPLGPADMRVQGKGVQSRYEKERREGEKSSLMEQEIRDCKEKVERRNRKKDKAKEASETRR